MVTISVACSVTIVRATAEVTVFTVAIDRHGVSTGVRFFPWICIESLVDVVVEGMGNGIVLGWVR